MSYWSWDSSLSVGVDAIDNQHRRIVGYINELHVAWRSRDPSRTSQVLAGLADYTRTHRAFEEDLMRQAGYPLCEAHKKAHEAFIGHVSGYVEQHESCKDVTRKLLSELQIWLTNHIRRDDRDYAPYAYKAMNPGWLKRMMGRFFG